MSEKRRRKGKRRGWVDRLIKIDFGMEQAVRWECISLEGAKGWNAGIRVASPHGLQDILSQYYRQGGIMKRRRPIVIFAIAAVFLWLFGCVSQETHISRPDGRFPMGVTVEGDIRGFPEQTGEFTRDKTVVYVPGLRNVSVGYNRIIPGGKHAVTLYFYPKQDNLEQHFAQVKKDVLTVNRGEVRSEDRISLSKGDRSYPALKAKFSLYSSEPAFSMLILAELPDQWLKVRSTGPAGQAANIESATEKLINTLDWENKHAGKALVGPIVINGVVTLADRPGAVFDGTGWKSTMTSAPHLMISDTQADTVVMVNRVGIGERPFRDAAPVPPSLDIDALKGYISIILKDKRDLKVSIETIGERQVVAATFIDREMHGLYYAFEFGNHLASVLLLVDNGINFHPYAQSARKMVETFKPLGD